MADLHSRFTAEVSGAVRTRIGFLAAVPFTLLPERYRRKCAGVPDSQLLGPAAFSGLLQLSLFSFLYIALFFADSNRYMLFPILEHLVDPKTIPVAYLAIEGFVRFAAAAFASEVVPTLPLVFVAWILQCRVRHRERRVVGPRVPDRVTRGDGKTCDWCVESWGPKEEWDSNPYLIIAYDNAFYEVVGRETRQPPRPHVYLLRKPPDWKLVVRPHRYEPDPAVETHRATSAD